MAILLRPYVEAVLAGRKTVESRLTRSPLAPFRAIAPGERIYFKQSSGPFRARAVAGAVHFEDNLTPQRVMQLMRTWNDRVLGEAAFWQWKKQSRFATFVELERVEAIDAGPLMPPSTGRAWFVLDSSADPVFDVPVTGGALRNRYLTVPRAIHRFPDDAYAPGPGRRGTPVRLELPDGTVVLSDALPTGMLRWRGWGPWFDQWQITPGGAVRFVRLGPRRYRVTPAGGAPLD